jgi:glycosyltransferase involved in cell wall biosynthesis
VRILIDLQGNQNNSRERGIGRYSLALTKAIARNAGGHQIFILLNSLFPETVAEIKQSLNGLIPESNIFVFTAPGPVDELLPDNHWRTRSGELLREYVIDLIAPDAVLVTSLIEGACDNTLSSVGKLPSSVPVAMILYDLIPFLDPEKYIAWKPSSDWYYGKIDSLKRADLLLAISKSAANEAIEALGLKAGRVATISSAADEGFSDSNVGPAEAARTTRRFGIVKKYLMHSSAFDPRKNFDGLIRAFGLLPKAVRKQYQLVLVCKLDTAGQAFLRDTALKAGLAKNDLVLTNFVTDRELVVLYSACHLFVFPSLYEGFGLPALEAMRCGAATIGSNTSSIPEVIERADALFNPHSDADISAAIKRALTDGKYWKSLKAHARVQSAKFSWDASALVALEALQTIHRKSEDQKPAGISHNVFIGHVAKVARILAPEDNALIELARHIDSNERAVAGFRATAGYGGKLAWRVEGPFDSTYSLALLNREMARALAELGHEVSLHSTEGPGDFDADPEFLSRNPDLTAMNELSKISGHESMDVVSRNLYPPRVSDMRGKTNFLLPYAWEESGFPTAWVDEFNTHLEGIPCLSEHVRKVLLDNGVSVPLSVASCGVDHWERIEASDNYPLNAKKFRFLHVSSCFPRKGADALLDAYADSFVSSDNVSLIIKTFKNPHNQIHDWLKERKDKNASFPDVVIIEGDLTDSDLKALYQQCDVLVAPSRAEGFGLPMAEAMLSGLPVITTAWSGQLDFCNKDTAWLVDFDFRPAQSHFNLPASVWAEVKIDDLAKALRVSYEASPVERREKAARGRELLLDNFTWKSVAARAVESARSCLADGVVTPELAVGWVTTWNTKCGIATYSQHLIDALPARPVILAPDADELTREDDENCIRCWKQGKENNRFDEVERVIAARKLNCVVIQFNYGFYDFADLATFINTLVDQGRVVVVMLHSTTDPFAHDQPNWRLVELRGAFERCARLLVHSVSDLNRLKTLGLVNNVALIPHGILDSQVPLKPRRDDLPLVAAYGFCLPHKGLPELVAATAELAKGKGAIRLRLVNAEYPDPISSGLVADLQRQIKDLGISDLVEFHTGFLADEESLALLSDADLLVFPYQATGESASGAARYGLATKRPVVVTPLAIFDDLGGAVHRLEGMSPRHLASGISDVLEQISSRSEQAVAIAQEADRWRGSHDYKQIATRLYNLFVGLQRNSHRRQYSFFGSSAALRSIVGEVHGRSLVATNNEGFLAFGPYVPAAAGRYRASLYGFYERAVPEGTYVDVSAFQGSRLFARQAVVATDAKNVLHSMEFEIDEACDDLEIRLWVPANSGITMSRLEIDMMH